MHLLYEHKIHCLEIGENCHFADGCFSSYRSRSLAQNDLSEAIITDQMTDGELRNYRNMKVAALEQRWHQAPIEQTTQGKRYRIFYCSLYYTPRESGFNAQRGFNMTPMKAPGLGGRIYPRSLLEAVKKEGFGRLKEPVNGLNYIQYIDGGRYRFAKAPLGYRDNVLIPRQSCAVSRKNPYLKHEKKIWLDSPLVAHVTGNSRWEIADTGGGIHPLQIDLYWGEDDPMGPVGRQLARPAGTKMEYVFDVGIWLD